MDEPQKEIEARIIALLNSNKLGLDDLHTKLAIEGFKPQDRYPAISSLYTSGKIAFGELISVGNNTNAFARQIIVTDKKSN